MNPHNIPPLSEFRYRQTFRYRFSDVDVLGHVNNTIYLSFLRHREGMVLQQHP